MTNPNKTPSEPVVECLACGHRRTVPSTDFAGIGECPECSYVGWALPSDLDPSEREQCHKRLAPDPALLAKVIAPLW